MIAAIKATRRRFFGLAPGGVLAAKMAAEKTALGMTGSFDTPHTAAREILNTHAKSGPAEVFNWQLMRDKAVRLALSTPSQRAELESILYERYRRVHHLDMDLAANRSYSLAAKMCYQRQRLVEHEIGEAIADDTPYNRMRGWVDKVLSALDWVKPSQAGQGQCGPANRVY